MNNPNKYLLALLATAIVVALILTDVYLIGKNLLQLTSSVISDIVAVLLSFIVIYFFLESRGMLIEGEPMPPIVTINPSIADLREWLKKDNEITDLKNRFDNAASVNSQSIKDLRIKLEGDLQAIDRKIEEIIKQISSNSNKMDKARLGATLDELLAERSKKAGELEKLTESIRISILLQQNLEQLEKLRKENEAMKQKSRRDEALIQANSDKLEKLTIESLTRSDELQRMTSENNELKTLLRTNSDEVKRLTNQNMTLNNQIVQLQQEDSENVVKLKNENKRIKDLFKSYVHTTEEMNAEAKPIINK